MKLGFCLFKYFPYGGLQKDFMDIALQCQKDGHQVFVYTLAWQGEMPAEFQVRLIESKALSNHKKYEQYHQKMMQLSAKDGLDCVIGFNKMPGLDVYFASDPSYKAKAHNVLQRLGARYQHFMQYEEAVCGQASHTMILTLAPTQQQEYQRAWDIDDNRFILLPPGISRDAMQGSSAATDRTRVRSELGIAEDELLLLMIGSGFRTKGLDRALLALSALPQAMQNKTRLVVIGQDKPDSFDKMASKMGLSNHVDILPGRDDIAAVMQAGDCLIHPAYREVAGKVILEAVVAGLPVLVTDVCGYAHHVKQADAGYVLGPPFVQQELNDKLVETLASDTSRQRWRENGIAYGQSEDLYQMAEVAAQFMQRHCREKVEKR
jgi:UDP-glucose:(heptosyl)LPS alpha-1,3-glucosyltransferase